MKSEKEQLIELLTLIDTGNYNVKLMVERLRKILVIMLKKDLV